jgi:hypothetical protein
MDRLEEEGGVDVVHVEGRILAHQHHVELGQLHPPHGPGLEVVALDPLHLDVAAAREDPAVLHRQRVRQVDEQRMAPRLARLHHQEGRVALDVHALDGVHLDGDLQGHADFLRR